MGCGQSKHDIANGNSHDVEDITDKHASRSDITPYVDTTHNRCDDSHYSDNRDNNDNNQYDNENKKEDTLLISSLHEISTHIPLEEKIIDCNTAAGAVQRIWWGYRARITYCRMRLEKEKVLCIQHAWRRVVARERARCLRKLKLDEYTEATIKIQNTYRKWRAMKKLYLLRERKRSIQRRICATRIQTQWRCHISRRVYHNLKHNLMEKKAQEVQRVWRGIRGRTVVRNLRRQCLEEASSIIVQLAWRRRRAVMTMAAHRAERDLRAKAAIFIQSICRASLAANRVRRMREERRKRHEFICATKLQTIWRCHKAMREVCARRLRKIQFLLETRMAIVIQCRCRVWLAQHEVHRIIEADKVYRENCSVTKIQSMWRMCLARNLREDLEFDRMIREAMIKEETLKELECNMAIRIQSMCRARMARKELVRKKFAIAAPAIILRIMRRAPVVMRHYHPHSLLLSLLCAGNINAASGSVSNAYVVVSAFGESARSARALNPHMKLVRSATKGPHDRMNMMLCYYKSKVMLGTVNPEWREDALVSSATWNSKLVVTVLHRSSFGKDVFLGQTVLDLLRYPNLYTGEVVELPSVQLQSFKYPVLDPVSKNEVPLRSNPPPGKGTISMSLRLPLLARSMCGWVYRASTFHLTKGQFKRRWMVLIDFKLSFYQDPFSLENLKGTLNCADVTAVEDENADDGSPTLVMYYGAGDDFWTLKWDHTEPPYIRRMWREKILKSCSHLR